MMTSNTDHPRSSSQQNDYSTFASFVAADVDRSTLVFNRFDRLAARNLLIMQSELNELQTELDMMDMRDIRSSESKEAPHDWVEFKRCGESEPRRMQLVHEIRSLMSEYSMANSNHDGILS